MLAARAVSVGAVPDPDGNTRSHLDSSILKAIQEQPLFFVLVSNEAEEMS